MDSFRVWVLAALLLACLRQTLSSDYSYAQAMDSTLLFFEAQRSGKLPPDQRTKWRSHSGLLDGHQQGVDLVGGYYDAGDHVKFGLPMAFAVTMMAWGAVDFRKEMTDLNQMDHILKAIRWGTDYFLKAHTQPDVFWAQVGDGDTDHYCWERPENMTTPRTGYKLDPNTPGSDVAGETAAALAASSLAFRPYNISYSNLLLVHAKQLFSFADRVRGLYVDSIRNANKYYASSGYSDELLWGATWLYRATGDEYYLKYVMDNAVYLGGTGWAMKEFSWDNKYAGIQVLLSEVLLEGKGRQYASTLKQYQAKANYFACACIQKNGEYSIEMTAGGLMYVREWNNMQYASAAAFLLALYSEYLGAADAVLECPDGRFPPKMLLDFAKSQADYILGNNPESMSYLVGYGEKYPVRVHHRGASIASVFELQSTVKCAEGFEIWYRRPERNPNVVHGGLVGGPDKHDRYSDDRSDYEQSEPTISGTAPLVGLFSILHSKYGKRGYWRPQNPGSNHSHSQKQVRESAAQIQIVHAITKSWRAGTTRYYRHKVILKNTSSRAIRNLQLRIENLTGTSWGLKQTTQRYIYSLAQQVLEPEYPYTIIYVQEGSQAKVTVVSYDEN